MCWNCGTEQDFSQSVYRTSTCPSCGADLHSCRGCSFYAPGSHFDCHETVDEIIVEKEKANFCEHFKAGLNSNWGGKTGGSNGKNAAALNALFGDEAKSSGADGKSKTDQARDAFNSLFG